LKKIDYELIYQKIFWRNTLKQFAKILILVVILASSLQGCSWISKKWDERPSWMGGDKVEKE